MALRDKMASRSQPFLEEGEQIRQVFWSQTGASPWLLFLSSFSAFFFKYRIVCVTDRAVVVMVSSRWMAKPKSVLARLPRATYFGPMTGLWGKTQATGENLYINRRFHKDVAAADAELQSLQSQGA